jgi:hypothetical protein
MDKFSALSKGMQILLVSAVLLLIDTFFHWQSVDVGPFEVGQNAWHGFWGVMLGLLTIAIIAWAVVRILQPELLKSIPAPEGTLVLGLGALILVFAVLKNLIDDYSAWAAYVGIILAAGVAFGAWLHAQDVGFTMPAWTSSGGGTSNPSPPPPPAQPAPPVPEPPAATTPEETPRPPVPEPPIAPVVPGEPSRSESERHGIGDTTPADER